MAVASLSPDIFAYFYNAVKVKQSVSSEDLTLFKERQFGLNENSRLKQDVCWECTFMLAILLEFLKYASYFEN